MAQAALPLDQNLLVHGDNRAALDALLPALAGQVRCAYLDPPYNTGSERRGVAGSGGYLDTRRPEDWRALMAACLGRVREALRVDGSVFVQLDDAELDGCKLLMDELFGRAQFIARVTVAARAPSAFSTVNPGVFKESEYLLWYARDRARFRWNPQRVPRPRDRAYGQVLLNPEDPPEAWRLATLRRACPPGQDPERFALEQAHRLCRLAEVSVAKVGRAVAEARERSLSAPGAVRLDRPGQEPIWLMRGRQLLFYERQLVVVDGQRLPSRPLTNIWTDLRWEGIAAEGGVRYKAGKKPERLLRRCLALASDPGDWVLDPFAGSGTTAAVAHKMGRRWVAVEAGPAVELARARLERVVRGEDPTGVSALEGWTGGGSFGFRAL